MGKTSVASDNSGLASRDKSDKFWYVNGIRLVKIKEMSRGLAHRICFASVVTYFVVLAAFFKVVIVGNTQGKSRTMYIDNFYF